MVEKCIQDTLHFNSMSVDSFSFPVWARLDLNIQHRICDLCGGRWIVPVQLEMKNDASIFGVSTAIGILVVLDGQLDAERIQGRIVTPRQTHTPSDFSNAYILHLFEANQENGKLVLRIVPLPTKLILIDHVRKNYKEMKANSTDSFFANIYDNSEEYATNVKFSEILPSGRCVHDICKRWKASLM